MRVLDRFLNGITMYRLVLYGLMVLAAIGIIFGALGLVSVPPVFAIASLGMLSLLCYWINIGLAKLYGAAPGSESSLITSLILFCIFSPPTTVQGFVGLAIVAIVAMASKYVLAFKRKHIFNPAAIGAVVGSVSGLYFASWWIGSAVMLPFTLVLGALIVRKIRRSDMAILFGGAAIVMITLLGLLDGRPITEVAWEALASWPIVFFATVMLTEPFTTPPTQRERWAYAVLVAVLFSTRWHLGNIYASPEWALVLGNIFAAAVSPKGNVILTLKKRTEIAPNTYDFEFEPSGMFPFSAGQYMEWTLPHAKPDGRGNRRYFTIASSPTEKNIHLGVKTYTPSSSYKQALLTLPLGARMTGGQLSGDFTLPENVSEKLVFIAGGIGITPFRSMVQYLRDSGQKRDIVIFYGINQPADTAYSEVLEGVDGVRVVYVLGAKEVPKDWSGRTGFITADLIRQEVSDFAERRFYISGPNVMVNACRKALSTLDVTPSKVVTDYFPGY